MTRWTEEQIEAMIELGVPDDSAPAEPTRPVVATQCICPNNHEPDAHGMLITSPSCQLHGCRSRFIPVSRLTQQSARTVGVIHSHKGN